MTAKQALHAYIEALAEDEAAWLWQKIQWDKDERAQPLTDTEAAEVAMAIRSLRRGEGIPHDEAMRRLRAIR